MERKRTTNQKEKENLLENGQSSELTQKSDLKGDKWNIMILLFLYTLQGIPLGLSSAIPMILQNRGVSYKQQAEFSFVYWPFSLKLLWAPLVDAIFSTRIGRRKTWLIPVQYLIGAFMLLLSTHVDTWLGDEPNIGILTFLFFLLNFLAATQDIAVDGWALTMLKKCNVGHASTCNSVGQSAGFFLSYVVFMALESASFCNTYLRSEPQDVGLVTLPQYFYFWGVIFILSTTLVAIFKKELEPHDGQHEVIHERDIKTAYTSLWHIVKLPPIQSLIPVLLTCKIGFSATDNVMTLKLVEAGIPKEKLALMAIPLIPIQLVLPLIISKYITGPQPLEIYIKAIPYRLLFGLFAAFLVWVTPVLVPNGNELSVGYVILLIGGYGLHQVCVYAMFVSIMAFFAKVSDSSVGGTYMTLLNTLSNLGGNWPAILALYFVDPLTWKECKAGGDSVMGNTCETSQLKEDCINAGGKCFTQIDGFYLETALCTAIGFVWLLWGRKQITKIESYSESAWKLKRTKKEKR